MPIQQPPEPSQLGDDVQAELVELHLVVVGGGGLDDDARALRHVGGAFGELDAGEHGDGEVFAGGFSPAEDVPGEGAEGGCCFDDGGCVG